MRAAVESGDNWTLPAVPALWQAWHEAGVLSSRIKTAISAGAPLPLRLERAAFDAHGVKIHNFLGSSECGGIAYDRAGTPRDDASRAGSPLENVRASVTDDGCLAVEGAAVASGYWPQGDPALADGRFEMTDLAEIIDGVIHLRGRASDRINVAGRKIAPETIEQALLDHEFVRQCLVFGVPSEAAARNEEIVAVVACAPELREALKARARESLPAWQVPRHWRVVDTLNANARGKLSRAEWRRQFLEGD